MFPIRIKACSESDLRMLGNLAHNIQRVLPVTQADIDAAAALGKGWVVWKVVEVNDPLDNLRGGTQLVIKQNSITPGQNVRRVLIVSGPGGETVVIGPGPSPLLLPDAIANSLTYVKAFGGTEQRNLPDNYIQRDYIYIMSGAYLLTDIVPTYDYKIEMDFKTTTVSASKTVLGGRTAVYGGMEVIIASSKNFVVDAFGTDSAGRYSSSVTAQNNTRYKFTYANQVATLESGGATLFTNTMTGTAANGATLCINGNNDNGSIPATSIGEIYLYSFKVWNGQGELVADYVPAVEKGSTPVVGFYDTVSKTFKTVTAGTIAAGTETVPTPDTPMDIVSNNGVLKLGYTSRNLNVGTLDNQGYTSTGGTSTSTTFCGTLWKIKVTPGEKYTVSFGNFPDGVSGVFINTWLTDGTWNLRQAISISGDYTYTIPAGVGEVNFTLYKTGGITIGSNSWLQVEKGETATPYVPAGYGLYVDGTTETINVHGSNIFDKNDTENIGSWYSGSNQTITQAAANATLVMRAKPNTTYYFKHCSVKGGCRAFYTEVEDWEIGSACSAMSGNAGANANVVYSITTSANAKWIFFNYGRSNLEASLDDQRNDFMVSTSGLTSDTPYEQYFNGGTATAEMLLKVGDYQDEQEILSGAVTRKVGVKVFDGTENVGTSNATFTVAIADRVSSKMPLVCSHFEYSTKTSSQVEDLKVISFSSTNIGFRYDACANATAFKTWLANQYAAGTPVIVVYQLATETTESVAGQPLQVADGDNILEITQASLSDLQLEAEYTKVA